MRSANIDAELPEHAGCAAVGDGDEPVETSLSVGGCPAAARLPIGSSGKQAQWSSVSDVAASLKPPSRLRLSTSELLVHSLLGNAKHRGDLLPAPTSLARRPHLQFLDCLQQRSKRRNRA